jgi:hypothetical protein
MKKLRTLLLVPILALFGCNATPGQVTNVTNAVFTDLQAACMAVDLATVVIPQTPSDAQLTAVVDQVQKDCSIAQQLLPSVQNAVNAFIKNVGVKRGKCAMVNGRYVGVTVPTAFEASPPPPW